MKMKIKLGFDVVCHVIPEAAVYPHLPRRRKKKMKKYITNRLIELAEEYVINLQTT
jgi:hypothetical protein